MNPNSRDHYAARMPTLAHKGYIEAPRHGADLVDPNPEILRSVFQHQPAVYDAYSILETLKNESKHILNDKELSSYFYMECFVERDVVQGFDFNNGSIVKCEDFINEVVLYSREEDRNRLFGLVGEVGIGKTSFINWMISTYGYKWVQSNNCWFVRLDLETGAEGKLLKEEYLLQLIAKKTIGILRKRPEIMHCEGSVSIKAEQALEKLKEIDSKLNMSPQDFGDRMAENPEKMRDICKEQREQFVALVHAIREDCKRTLFLIIDNIDYITHINDRTLFFNRDSTREELQPEGNYTQKKSPPLDTPLAAPDQLVDGLCRLVGRFYHESLDPLSHLGANILFVMRQDTYEIISQAGLTSLPQKWTGIYTSNVPNYHDVMLRRGQLYDFAVATKKNGSDVAYKSVVRGQVSDFISDLSKELDSGPPGEPPLRKHLDELTNHGLREMMKYFEHYSHICQIRREGGQGSEELEARSEQEQTSSPFHRYPVGLLTFILGRRRLYNQFTSEFPNIYLVCSQFRQHEHSYWLKRLVMEYVYSNSKYSVDADEIIYFFRRDEKRGSRGYEDEVIRECLGSVTDVNYSNLLHVAWTRLSANGPLVMSNISITKRGMHSIPEVYDKFFYLQLIVDDHMLPLPISVIEEFEYPEPSFDYSYLAWEQPQYSQAAKKMIALKAKQVLLFLEILEASLKCEQQKYSSVFEKLAKRKIPIPDVNKIRLNVISELNDINSKQGKFMNVQELVEEAKRHQTPLYKDLILAYDEDVW